MKPPEETTQVPGQGRAGQDPLLAEARSASQEAAESAAAREAPPLDWEVLSRRRAARSRAAAWAAVLVPLLLVGGSAGTWALVQHLRAPELEAVDTARRLPAPPPVVEREVTPPRRAGGATPAPEPPVRQAKRTARRAARPRSDAAVTTSGADAGPPREIVVLPGRVTGDDEVIIVTPKAKQKPLWTVEGFKRRGMKGFLKKVDPVKPAPEGIEHQIP